MADAQETNGNGGKRLGRNQKIAIGCYAMPFLSVVMPAFYSLVTAADEATKLAIIDKLATFAEVYGLVAVGSILVASGIIKSISAVAGAIGNGKT